MSSTIPSSYRIWFTVGDPILSLSGIIGNLFAPATILNSYSPSYKSPPAIETLLSLDIVAGFLAGFVVLQVFLLRAKPTDLTVWRALQASMLVVDFFMLAGFARALWVQGRMTPMGWRDQEWTNIGITGGVAVIRSAFLMGVGMAGETKRKSKGRRK